MSDANYREPCKPRVKTMKFILCLPCAIGKNSDVAYTIQGTDVGFMYFSLHPLIQQKLTPIGLIEK